MEREIIAAASLISGPEFVDGLNRELAAAVQLQFSGDDVVSVGLWARPEHFRCLDLGDLRWPGMPVGVELRSLCRGAIRNSV